MVEEKRETNKKVNDEGIHLKEILEDEVCERIIEKTQKNVVKKKKEIAISCSCQHIEYDFYYCQSPVTRSNPPTVNFLSDHHKITIIHKVLDTTYFG